MKHRVAGAVKLDVTKRSLRHLCANKCFPPAIFFVLVYAVFCVEFFYESNDNRDSRAAARPQIQTKTCGLHFRAEISPNPLLNLDPTRFVLPILYNGPTNQLIGLRDTVFLAILLNRTVIIPRFYKHFTDPSKRARQLDERLRIDIERLSNFVSVVPYSAVATACGNHFGVAFLGQPRVRRQFKIEAEFLESFNFTLERGLDGEEYNVVLDPRDSKARNKSRDLTTYYKSNATCAMFYYAYRSVGVRERPPLLREAKKAFSSKNIEVSADKTPTNLLYAMVCDRVGRPQFIDEICDDFIREVIGTGGYLAIHWRFDPDDWLRKCKRGGDAFAGMCKQINSVGGEHIVQAAVGQLEKLPKDRISRALYFATPIDNREIASSVRSAAQELNRLRGTQLRVVTEVELMAHLRKYAECRYLSGCMEDVLASVEMQICAGSTSFMFSSHSSWSAEVLSQRTDSQFAKLDRDVLRATAEALQARESQVL